MSRLTQLRTAYGKYRQDPGVTAAMTRPVIDPVQVAIQEYRVFLTWGVLPQRMLGITRIDLSTFIIGMDRHLAFEANAQRQAMMARDQFILYAQAWQRNTGFDPLEYLRELSAAQTAQATTETTAIAAEPVAVIAVAAPVIPVATRVSTCAASCVSTCAASWTTTFPDNWSES